MFKINTFLRKNLILGLFTVSFSASNVMALSPDSKENVPKTEKLVLKKDQVLTVVLPVIKEGGQSVVNEYSGKVFPLAQKFGLKNLFNLKVKQTIIGDIKPPVFALFSWPDKTSEQMLLKQPEWPEIKAMRPNGWEHLNVFNATLTQDIEVNFSSEHHYTAVIAWFDPEHSQDYLTYLNNIEAALNDVGGKFILKLPYPEFETHSYEKPAPGQITFVQWPNENGFRELQKHQGYQKHTHLFRSGLKSFEFYGLGVQ